MEKNKSESNLLSLGNDHCSIKDEDSTRNEEYVEEEHSMSEHLSSIDNVSLNIDTKTHSVLLRIKGRYTL
jgi:hypothetical protein